jgi:hypothetical protein
MTFSAISSRAVLGPSGRPRARVLIVGHTHPKAVRLMHRPVKDARQPVVIHDDRAGAGGGSHARSADAQARSPRSHIGVLSCDPRSRAALAVRVSQPEYPRRPRCACW